MQIQPLNINNQLQINFCRKKIYNFKPLEPQIKSMLNDNCSIKTIAETLQVSTQMLYRYLTIKGIKTPRKIRKEHSKDVFETLFAKFKTITNPNINTTELAKETGFSTKEIKNWLAENANYIKRLIRLDLLKQGKSNEEIAKECGITERRVLQIRKELENKNLLPKPQSKKDRENAIVQDLKNGVPVKEIAKKYNVKINIVYHYKQKHNIQKSDIIPVIRNKILELARNGLSIRQIAKELGKTEKAISNNIIRYDLRGELESIKDSIKTEIYKNFQQGLSLEELCTLYGYSKRKICYILKSKKAEFAQK